MIELFRDPPEAFRPLGIVTGKPRDTDIGEAREYGLCDLREARRDSERGVLRADTTLETMKSSIDRMAAESGGDSPLPYVDYPLAPKAQPPHWRYYRLFADYYARLGFVMSLGARSPQLGLLTRNGSDLPVETVADISEALAREHIDFAPISDAQIARSAVIDQRLRIGSHAFEALAVPRGLSLTTAAAERVAEFAADGGRLIDIDPGERVDLHGLIGQSLRLHISIRRLDAQCVDVLCSRRVTDSGEIVFMANTSRQPREVRVSIRSDEAPYVLDLESGAMWALPNCAQVGGKTHFLHRFERYGSLALYLASEPFLAASRETCVEGRETLLEDRWRFALGDLQQHAESGEIENGSWTTQGYPDYVGPAVYSQTVRIPTHGPGARVFLKADNPADVAQFAVNGVVVGTRAWAPYQVEITDQVLVGPNLVQIVVTGGAPGGKRPAGLLGGARVIIRDDTNATPTP